MDRDEAERLLEDVEVVPLMQAAFQEAKEIVDACLAADVPAVLGRDEHCVKGCAPKLLVLARAEDAPRVAEVLKRRFGILLEREGSMAAASSSAGVPNEALPCPACGTVVPEQASECPDCGLGVG
jgi:hypothetical protein